MDIIIEKTRHITLRMKESLIERMEQRIDQFQSEESRTAFIINAIEEKLDNQQQSSKEFSNMAKKVETLNTKPTEQKVADIEIKLQIIYGELQRQNEILKLIHRRSTFAANFSLHALDELKKSTSFSDTEKQELADITDNEIKQSGIQFLRK